MAEKLFVLDTEMIQVADKIREKTGTTDLLSWPQDYINAVETMSSGDSLNNVIFDGNWHDTMGFKTDNTSKTIVDNTVSPATVKFSGGTTNSDSAAYMELQIDGKEALEIEYTFTEYQWAYIGISTDKTWYNAKTTNLVSYRYHAEGTSINERTTITLPLSGLSGTYYLKIYSWSGSSHTFSLYNMRFI